MYYSSATDTCINRTLTPTQKYFSYKAAYSGFNVGTKIKNVFFFKLGEKITLAISIYYNI